MMPNKHKTKIVCTVGPASDSPLTLESMILAGMNVARLNFSHGDFDSHAASIKNIRAAAAAVGRQVAIMGDLPGPKMRIGSLQEEPLWLRADDSFTLSTEDIIGDRERAAVSFCRLPEAVKTGDRLFLNDGIIHLQVAGVEGSEVHCQVLVGGELRSRKGLNLPGINLGVSAFTDNDHACLKFASEQGIDAVSQSFVANAADVEAVRHAAAALDYQPFIIAKIERSQALDEIDGILDSADGIMVARGDLGVEIPIERMAIVQKALMDKAVRLGKPVITATQMLGSMVKNRRPTRAEATDVANAILDGTDCVMLSEESAMGEFPVAAVGMLASIATETEPHQTPWKLQAALQDYGRDGSITVVDLIALNVELTMQRITPAALIVPTLSGATARNITRFRLPVWITAFTPVSSTSQALQFSYGINPVVVERNLKDWNLFSREWLKTEAFDSGLALLVQGPSGEHPEQNHRLEILELG
ncbi:MAG: pyruvate kinase [Pseudomonadota bacterium]|nr:pyruvate kinase [Pseudomonadota bacterium]